jgi:hypothetical protein
MRQEARVPGPKKTFQQTPGRGSRHNRPLADGDDAPVRLCSSGHPEPVSVPTSTEYTHPPNDQARTPKRPGKPCVIVSPGSNTLRRAKTTHSVWRLPGAPPRQRSSQPRIRSQVPAFTPSSSWSAYPLSPFESVMLCLDADHWTMEHTLDTRKGPDGDTCGNSPAVPGHCSLASPGRVVSRSKLPRRLRADAKEMT